MILPIVKISRFTKRILYRLLLPVIVLTIVGGPFSALPSQAQSKDEKPKLKKFGSSLERLKWDPAKQAAVETAGPQAADGIPVEDVFRITTDLVVCDVKVLDPQGRVVAGLTKNDFEISEDDQLEEIGHFSLGSDSGIQRSIVLIIDYSGSLLPYINWTVEAAKTLVDKLGPKDRMALVTDDVELLVDFTTDRTMLKKALDKLRSRALVQNHMGKSEQFSALMAAARELFDEEDIRPIIIFQTDGDQIVFLQPPDPIEVLPIKRRRALIKQFSLDDVYVAAEKSRATVYTVIPGQRLIAVPEKEQMERTRTYLRRSLEAMSGWSDDLKRNYRPDDRLVATTLRFILQGQVAAAGVAKLTGGWTTFLEQPDQAEAIYSGILSDLNDRYVLGYYPSNKVHDGKRRKVLVTVRNHPEYTVWGRKSYFAPPPEPHQ